MIAGVVPASDRDAFGEDGLRVAVQPAVLVRVVMLPNAAKQHRHDRDRNHDEDECQRRFPRRACGCVRRVAVALDALVGLLG